MKKRIMAAIMAAALALSLTACGGSSGGASSGSGSSGSAQTDAKSDGPITFTISSTEDIQSLDPGMAMNTPSSMLFPLAYDNLIRTDAELKFHPGLFKEWSSSEDGKDWSVTLQEGVKFHSGDPFDTKSIKATFERYAQDGTLRVNSSWKTLDNVEIVDDTHCIFHFSSPFATFESTASNAFYINAYAWEKEGDAYFDHVDGCGPYRLTSWDPGNEVVFELDKEYEFWDSATYSPNVDKIVYKPVNEDITRVSSIKVGEFQMILSAPFEEIEGLKSAEGVTFVPFTGTQIGWFGLQCAEGKFFNDINIRRALSMCIDRESIVSAIYGGMGTASTQFTIPFDIGYIDGYESDYYKYDPDKARELLAQSSYNGEAIDFMAASTFLPRTSELVQAIISMMEDVGFNVELSMLESASFLDRRASGDYDMCLSNFDQSANSAFWCYLQVSTNYGNYNGTQEVRDAFEAANGAPNAQEQQEKLQAAYKIMNEDCDPLVGLFILDGNYAVRDGWSNFVVRPNRTVDLLGLTYTK